MSVDAAAAVCCCNVSAECCFPIAQCNVSISLNEHYEITFDGVVLRSEDRVFTLQTTMVRKLVLQDDFTFRIGMSSEGGSASSNQQVYTTYFETPIAGVNCVGFPNEFYCPPCKTPLPCSRAEDVFSGNIPNGSVVTLCQPFFCGGTLVPPPMELRLVIPAGVVTISQLGLAGSVCEGDTINGVGQGISQVVYGKAGCFSLTSFDVAHWNFHSIINNYTCSISGFSVPFTECGSPFLCNYLSAPNQSWCAFPSFEDYTANSCNIDACFNPFTCYIFDCNSQVTFQSECGCDGVLDASGFSIGSETGSLAVGTLAQRVSRSVNITFTP